MSLSDKKWAETMFDAAFGGPTREHSVAKLADLIAAVRRESGAVLSAEVLRLLGCRDREDVEGIARAAKLLRDDAKECAS